MIVVVTAHIVKVGFARKNGGTGEKMVHHFAHLSGSDCAGAIESTNQALQNNARVIINRHVTAKAWLTGYYIVEYEQHGADRAKYGEKLLQNLAGRLKDNKNFSHRNLRLFRQFYLTYKSLRPQVADFVLSLPSIWQTPSAKLQPSENENVEIWQSLSANLSIAQSQDEAPQVEAAQLFNKLSFSHLTLLLPFDDPLKRAFYETMAIRGTWSVRELQRQIDTNYYERSGWSKNPQQLAELVDEKTEVATLQNDIKSPFTFEFLGLSAKNVQKGSELEGAPVYLTGKELQEL